MVRSCRNPIPSALQQEFQDIANQIVYRLRGLLHQGKLTAYYFTGDGCQAVSSEFWATTAADGTMVSGTYWLFGEPTQRIKRDRITRCSYCNRSWMPC